MAASVFPVTEAAFFSGNHPGLPVQTGLNQRDTSVSGCRRRQIVKQYVAACWFNGDDTGIVHHHLHCVSCADFRIRYPHDSSGAHCAACARISCSVFVITSPSGKFVNGDKKACSGNIVA